MIGFGQTLIPDANFEQALINLGYDTGTPDGSVPTANINTVTDLDVSSQNISDLTGIEDFTALTSLNCNYNNLTSEDVIAALQSTTFYETTEEVEETEGEELRLFSKIKIIFMSGDSFFMSILSFILFLTLVSFIFLKNKNIAIYVGLIALLFGILGTIIGVIRVFDVIEAAGDISPSLVAGGMKVVMITTVYGLIIFIISVILRVISLIVKKR